MFADHDGKPLVGSNKNMLGARVGPERTDDIQANPDGYLAPATGGLSVTVDWKVMPHFLIPRRLRHLAPRATGKDVGARRFRCGDGPFEDANFATGLYLRVDTLTHGLIEPASRMSVDQYQGCLARTRNDWTIDES